MDPITIAAGVSVLGGLYQAYNAAQARGAQQDELNKIRATFDSIAPPEYNLSIQDPPELMTQKISSPVFGEGVKAPQFNMAAFKPEDLKVVSKYAPETVPKIVENNPTLISQTGDMKTGRDAQLAALKKFQQVGEGDFDPEYQEQVQKAKLGAQAEAQSRQASILQDFARRGQSGSGLSLAAQLGGASQAMNTNAMQGLEAASQSYKNRLNALAQGAQLGSQISQEDVGTQSRNADIINSFNQRMAANENAYQTGRVNTLNDAQLRNLQADQNVANANVNARNQASLADRNRMDDISKYNTSVAQNNQARDDSLQKFGYQSAVDDRNFQNNAAMTRANWQQDQINNQNKLKSQQYNDLMSKAQAQSGIGTQMANNNLGAAQDRNAAIQGLSNLGMTYAMGAQASDEKAKDRALQEKLASQYGYGGY